MTDLHEDVEDVNSTGADLGGREELLCTTNTRGLVCLDTRAGRARTSISRRAKKGAPAAGLCAPPASRPCAPACAWRSTGDGREVGETVREVCETGKGAGGGGREGEIGAHLAPQGGGRGMRDGER